MSKSINLPFLTLHQARAISGDNIYLGNYLAVCTKFIKLVSFCEKYERRIFIVVNQKIALTINALD